MTNLPEDYVTPLTRLVAAAVVAVPASSQLASAAFFVNNLFDELALLSFDQERGTRARVGFLTNQPPTFGISTRLDF